MGGIGVGVAGAGGGGVWVDLGGEGVGVGGGGGCDLVDGEDSEVGGGGVDLNLCLGPVLGLGEGGFDPTEGALLFRGGVLETGLLLLPHLDFLQSKGLAASKEHSLADL